MTDDLGPIRPGKHWYWIGATIALIGGVLQIGAIVMYFAAMADSTGDLGADADDLDELVLLGESDRQPVDFPDVGRYYVYVESPGDDPFDALVLAPEDVRVRADEGSAPLTVRPAQEQIRFEHGTNTAGAQLEFDIETPGTYEVAVFADDVPQTALYVGPEVERGSSAFGSWEVRRAIIANLLTGSLFVVGKVILIITAAKRSAEESRRRNLASSPPPPVREEVSV